MTLEGLLIAVAWDPSGKVTEIGLTTFDEQEYLIDRKTARLYALQDRLRRHVRLTGTVEGRRVIRMSRFDVLRPDAESRE